MSKEEEKKEVVGGRGKQRPAQAPTPTEQQAKVPVK